MSNNIEERVREILGCDENQWCDEVCDKERRGCDVDQILQAFREHVDGVVVENPHTKPHELARFHCGNHTIACMEHLERGFNEGIQATKNAIKGEER